MPTLIKPGSVKVVTKEGEIQVSLTLDLNINLNTEGLVLESKVSNVEAQSNSSQKKIPDKIKHRPVDKLSGIISNTSVLEDS